MSQKIAIVTGGTSGIGEAIVNKFANEGLQVHLFGTNTQNANNITEHFKNTPHPIPIFHNVNFNEHTALQTYLENLIPQLSNIDILVNCAGVPGNNVDILNTSLAEWQNVININLTAPFLFTKAVIATMQQQNHGCIINIGSLLATRGGKHASAYTASKHGLAGLTKATAIEFAPFNIRANMICPGVIDTPMSRSVHDSKLDLTRVLHPLGRLGKPQDIANTVYWLCSDDASYITGCSIAVDGGMAI